MKIQMCVHHKKNISGISIQGNPQFHVIWSTLRLRVPETKQTITCPRIMSLNTLLAYHNKDSTKKKDEKCLWVFQKRSCYFSDVTVSLLQLKACHTISTTSSSLNFATPLIGCFPETACVFAAEVPCSPRPWRKKVLWIETGPGEHCH